MDQFIQSAEWGLMPIYTYRCPQCTKEEEHFQSLQDFDDYGFACMECCADMEVIIGAPLMVKVAQDVCYDSPIDGTPITSWAAREEDLKKHNCRPYDPEMKTDYTNRIKREDDALDQAVQATVEEAVEKMPTAKRAKLASDLLDKGGQIEYARGGT